MPLARLQACVTKLGYNNVILLMSPKKKKIYIRICYIVGVNLKYKHMVTI